MAMRVAAGTGATKPEPPFAPALVEEVMRAIARAVRAHQLYLPNNPSYIRTLDGARAAFQALWKVTDELPLLISEVDFTWYGVAVLSEPDKAGDALPWLFYKDGVRALRLLPGFEGDELVRLLTMIQRLRKASQDEADLLTMLWEQDFSFLRYQYVDLAMDGVASVDDGSTPEAQRRSQVRPPQPDDPPADPPRRGIVNIEDFDATLYFLDEREIEYLRSEVREEYAANLRQNVASIVLDIFERHADAAGRTEIADILDGYIVHLLEVGDFRGVAFVLRETTSALERAHALDASLRARITQLPDRLSDPASLAQLLQSLDDATALPPQSELDELFAQLRAGALGTLFAWLSRTTNARLKPLIETSAGRLAAANTAELVRLIGDADRLVAMEAMRRAGALRSPAAVAPLARVLTDADPAARLAAVQALGEIGTPGALQWLERGIDDADRDVRIAATRSLGARTHRPALARLDAAVKGKQLRDADLTEKMAVFEAYGALCGDGGVTLLDSILNARTFLGRREDGEMRACAAMALGRVATPRATESLQRAAAEKDVVVRNAVNKALRGGSP